MEKLHGCNCKLDSWVATLDKMPPGPSTLSVEGICTCPTGGYELTLIEAVPAGLNPRELVLDIIVKTPSGVANQMITDHPLKYVARDIDYDQVLIRPCGLVISVKVVR